MNAPLRRALLHVVVSLSLTSLLAACQEGPAGDPTEVRQEALREGLEAMPAAPSAPAARVALGQALLFDKVLSGNEDIACATCHDPGLGSADDRSLSIGVGGQGLGQDRTHPQGLRIPRNAPPLFNLHAQPVMFWDGRVHGGGRQVETPVGSLLPGIPSLGEELDLVAAQAMFPVTSREEMRGLPGENELGDVPDEAPDRIWAGLMTRLGEIPEYRSQFEGAFPGQDFDDMNFGHAASAIAAFEVSAFEASNTPWDRFLRGDDTAMSAAALRGAELFMGRARCSNCHDGAALSDFETHNTLVPQVGPGAGDGEDGRDDFGAMSVTGDPRDRYAFRTPPLRNVVLTAPYGHDGAFPTLRGFIEHYDNPERSLRNYSDEILEPALRGTLVDNHDAMVQTRSNQLRNVNLDDDDVDDLLAFMEALTDPRSTEVRDLQPERVPSGLPVRH